MIELSAEKTFKERYPQLAFILSLEHFSKAHVQHIITDEEVDSFKGLLAQADDISCIVVLGLSGSFYEIARSWLDHDCKQHLIFIEKDQKIIKTFLSHKIAKQFFSDPQVHLRYVMDEASIKAAFDEIAQDFPQENTLITALSSFNTEEDLTFLKEFYLRRSIIHASIHKEALYRQRLFENFFPNYFSLLKAKNAQDMRGQFQNIPAVICGAGPSLNEAIDDLKDLKDKALIIAGGSTITALSRQGVSIDLSFALDPNEEEYIRLKQASSFETPLLFATRVYPKIFHLFNGPLGYFKTHTGGPFEEIIEEKCQILSDPFHVGMKDEGMSVTVLCLASAIAMGCSPIFLVGVDLAYIDDKCYADKVLENNQLSDNQDLGRDAQLLRTNSSGQIVKTALKWVMESEVIAHFAQLHQDVKIYDCTQKGLGFDKLEKLHSSQMKAICSQTYDLSGFVHQKILALNSLSDHKEEVAT